MNDDLVINSILQIYQKFIDTNDINETGQCILQNIMKITDSTSSFISQVKSKDDIVLWSVSDGSCSKELYEKYKYTDYPILMHAEHTLLGKILTTKDYVIDNDIQSRKIKLPIGHQKLKTFIGIPLKLKNEVIGTICLANRTGGYNKHIINNIEPIVSAITTIMYGMYKNEDEIKLRESVMIKENELRLQKEISETQNNFLAVMSHEIRTPLNGICGMTEILMDTTLRTEQAEYLEIIQSCSDQLKYLIDNILDYSKLKAKKLKLINEEFKFTKCIESSFDALIFQSHKKELDISYDVDDNIPDIVVGDEYRLGQILKNLLCNSVKFTNSGYISLNTILIDPNKINKLDMTNKSELLQIDMTKYFKINNEKDIILLFEVSDSGIGIPADKLDTIFNHFTHVSTTYRRHAGGSGLGLAITKNLVELMGGNIWIHSKLDEGTLVYFTIKLTVNRIPLKEKNVGSKELLANGKVLIVDDNDINRKVLFKYLLSWDIYPTLTSSSDDALLLLNSGYTFDLILLDIHMPNIDGAQLAKIIKQKWPDIILIALSSIMDLNVKSRIYFEHILTKPIKKSKLKQVLDKVLVKNKITKITDVINSKELTDEILVVEDNKQNRIVATKLLNKMGYNNITDVSDGSDALKLIDKNPFRFSVILLDIIMPNIDGYEVVSVLREHYKYLIPRIIMLTALVTDKDVIKFRELGIYNYVTKPIDSKKLKKIIQNITNINEQD